MSGSAGSQGEPPFARKAGPGKVQEVARSGGTFRGVIIPTGPSGQADTVRMYVSLAESIGEPSGDVVLTPMCVELGELGSWIDKLKEDLDWVYEGMERARKKQQDEGTQSCDCS